MTNFIRMLMRNVFVNVFKSDAVIWWAAIFRSPSSMFDTLLHLSNSKSFAMSCSRSCNFCEAVGNLLTVTIQLAPLVSRCDSVASSTNQRHQLGFTRTYTNHVLFLGRRMHGILRVFNRTFDPNCNSRIAATIFDVSSSITIGHHHD